LILTGRQVESGEDYGQQKSHPFEQASEVVAGSGEEGVGGVSLGSDEIVPAHAVLGFGVSDDRLDRRSAPEFAFDGLSDAASLAGDIDPELVVGRGVMAAIAAVGDDAGKARADLRLDLRDHGRQRVAVALRAAKAQGLIFARERRRPGLPSLTNVLRVISAEWAAWLKLSGEWGGYRNLSATNNKFIQERKWGLKLADHWRTEQKLGDKSG
jgi:hypothetical protein